MNPQPLSKREQLLHALRAYLARTRMPRLVMSVILGITWATGFFCSRAFMHHGLERLGVRYCLATFVAWGALILLMRLWVATERSAFRSLEDIRKLSPSAATYPEDKSMENAGTAALRVLDAGSNVGDCDGCLFVILIGAAVFILVGVIGSIFSFVLGAPTLLAEALMDVVIAGTLTRGIVKHDAQWWAFGVIRRTWHLAISIAVTLLIAGSLLQSWKPHIRTIGDLFR